MKISVDAGALWCANKFGTYIVTQNIVKALSLYDKSNFYTGYLYKHAAHLSSSENFKYKVLRPSTAWMSVRVSIEELAHPKDVYLGLSQAIPWLSGAKIISLLHGLSFFRHKELYPDSYEALKDQVIFATSRSQKVIVSSIKVKKELAELFGYNDAVVIPFGVPYDMVPNHYIKSVRSLRSERPYFLFVGMDHKIKNIDFLVKAFTIFKEKPEYKDFELLMVGDHQKFTNLNLGIRAVTADRSELAKLYKNATGYLTASLYESFNLPVLEALAQNCAVVGKSSSIIPELMPFVSVADEVEEFVNTMNSIANGKNKIETKDIATKFSWEKYVNKLTSLY